MPKKRTPTTLRNYQYLEYLLVSEKRGKELLSAEAVNRFLKNKNRKDYSSNKELYELAPYIVWEGSFEKRIVGLQERFKAIKSKARSALPLRGIKLSEYKEDLDYLESALKIKQDFFEYLEKNGLTEKFNLSLIRLMIDFELDYSWLPYMALMVSSNYYLVPRFNLTAFPVKKNRTVVIMANPTTSIEDVRELFKSDEYEHMRIEAFNSIPSRRYYSKKRAENLELIQKYMELKSMSDYASFEDRIETDLSIVSRIFEHADDISKKADIKRVARIRTIKSRLKKM